jgi:2-octaprenyl-6-methoxyphenol hydroxylase
MVEKKEIVISGGGLAGLIAAAAFGNSGYEVLCIDPKKSKNKSQPEYLDIRTTAYLQPSQIFLQKIGVWQLVDGSSAPLKIMRIIDAAGKKLTVKDFNSSDISDTPFGWNVRNSDMRAGLLAKIKTLPNVKFEMGLSALSTTTRSSMAKVSLSNGNIVDCSLLIAADGRDSSIRTQAGVAVKYTDFGQSALSFSVTHEVPHNNISTEVHKAGGPFTLVPLPDFEGKPCSAIVWMDNTENMDKLKSLPDTVFDNLITERSGGVLGKLTSITNCTKWPIVSQLTDYFYAERTAFIAESAHVVPPIGAQGLNLSIGDIEALLQLTDSSANDIGSLKVLKKYHQIRRPIAQSRVIGVGLLNRASKVEGPMATHARAIGLSAIHKIKPLRHALMQLGIGLR